MCGIAGVVNLEKSSFDTNRLRQRVGTMLEHLAHRGPDQGGIEVGPNAIVGARRLRILGLESASDQPLRSSDSRCIVVFNGEIFNYLELREELKNLGHTFTSSGDTEVIVHAYEEWGVDCLERFNGMFAFAVVDSEQRQVFFARDRFGIKPLYYTRDDSLFVFASEPVALLTSGLYAVRIDLHTVRDYLRFGITDHSSSTFFEGLKQLAPGHAGLIANGAISLWRWYDPDRAHQSSRCADETTISGNFREAFEESIRLRMRSDVPVSLLLSGGIDSSSIAGVVGRIPNHSNLTAYSIGFPGTSLDETHFASLVSNYTSIPLFTENSDSFSVELLRECVRRQGEPVISPSVLAQWIIMRTIGRHGIRVVLSGQGADEYLAGYAYFDAIAIRTFFTQGRVGDALRHLLHPSNCRRVAEILAGLMYLSLPGPLRAAKWNRRWLRGAACTPQSCDYMRDLIAARELRETLIFHLRRRLPQLLRYEDRNSMSFSIESRHPFLDHRLVESVIAAPAEMIVGQGSRKRVLRRSLKDIIPAEVADRREKIGFQTPFTWLATAQFQDCLARLTANPPKELSELIDFKRVVRRSSAPQRRRRHNEQWRIFNLLIWYREVFEPIRQLVSADLLSNVEGRL